jgi:hypothetical protein
MPRGPYLLDQVVSSVGLLLLVAMAAPRWAQFSLRHGLQHCLGASFLVIILFLSTWKPDTYEKNRTAIIVAFKAAMTIYRARMQVRLTQPATGWLALDLLNAVTGELPCICILKVQHAAWNYQQTLLAACCAGLRLVSVGITGLLQTHWLVWVVQQVLLLASISNLDTDCRSPVSLGT